MRREVHHAIKGGAAGFPTSRSRAHQEPDSRPVASRLATWDEVRQLVGVMGDLHAGVFEIAREDIDRDAEKMNDYMRRLKGLALATGVPITFGLNYSRKNPHGWRPIVQIAH